MKLEVGKIYITRNGYKVKIIQEKHAIKRYVGYPYVGESEFNIYHPYWTEDGQFDIHIPEHRNDLVVSVKSVEFQKQLKELLTE